MKQVIIYPGRFQPMLSHHAEVYNQLQGQFPEADVYIGTSDKVESGKSPFSFKEKQLIAQAHGIDPSKVLRANRPYHKDDYSFDEKNTVIIFAVGEKDMDRFPFSNVDAATGLDMSVRDNTIPKYFQKINTYRMDPQPMAKRGYITLAPTISAGNEVASASAFRDALINAPDKESAEAIYTKQFGNFDPTIFNLVYTKITGQNDMNEELNQLRKLAGLQPLLESFDPHVEIEEEEDLMVSAEEEPAEEEEEDLMVSAEEEPAEEEDDGTETIQVNKAVPLAGDSIWDEDGANPKEVNVTEVIINAPVDTDDDSFVEVSVYHDGPWTVYTDKGFESEISKLVGFKVAFTEQGMQDDGIASLEGDKGDTPVEEELARMRHMSGLTEAEMPDFATGARPRNPKERDAYRKWKKNQSASAKTDTEAPLGISAKDRENAAGRPERAAASDPSTVGFNFIKPDDLKMKNGKIVPSSQRAKSVANQFPEDADINDPAVKKEMFLKFASTRPDLMFGEINARLANDPAGYAAGDRLSPIVRELEATRSILELEPADKSYALKLLQNAIDNMELVRAIDIDKQIDVEPMQLDVDDEDDVNDDDAYEYEDEDDYEYGDPLEPEDEALRDGVNFDSIRQQYHIKEEGADPKLASMIDEFVDDMSIELNYHGDPDIAKVDMLIKQGNIEDAAGEMADAMADQDGGSDKFYTVMQRAQDYIEHYMEGMNEGADGRDPVTGEISPDWKDANSMSREQFIQKYGAHAGARWDDVNGNTPEKRKANFATMSTADRAAAMRGESIEACDDVGGEVAEADVIAFPGTHVKREYVTINGIKMLKDVWDYMSSDREHEHGVDDNDNIVKKDIGNFTGDEDPSILKKAYKTELENFIDEFENQDMDPQPFIDELDRLSGNQAVEETADNAMTAALAELRKLAGI